MDKNKILKLTLAQFGIMQNPPMENVTLRLIATFARVRPDTHPDSILWSEQMKLAINVRTVASAFTPETSGRLEAAFRRRLAEDIHNLGIITIEEVIEGWFRNAEQYKKEEDRNWRNFQVMHILVPFLEGLQYLGFPGEEINKLKEPSEDVQRGAPSTRDAFCKAI